MNEEKLIKELEKLRDDEGYSKNKGTCTGYRAGILDAIDLVKMYISELK